MVGNRKAFGDKHSRGKRPNTCLIGCQEGDSVETMKDHLKDNEWEYYRIDFKRYQNPLGRINLNNSQERYTKNYESNKKIHTSICNDNIWLIFIPIWTAIKQ